MRSCVLLFVAACGSTSSPSIDAPAAPADAAAPIVAPNETWTWIPIDGMHCADGSPTGIGVNLTDRSDRVMIYMQGGGACWDVNTCFVAKTAVHIEGGFGESDLMADVANNGLFTRVDLNPFKDASLVYVPYCTGDLHDGANVMTYDASHVVHHVGRDNARALFARVAATRPTSDVVWLTGASAGAYGVGFDYDLARAAWPSATIRVLADSSPLVTMEPTRWTAMQAAWSMTFPSGCTNCAQDLGEVSVALRTTMRTGDRYALLANTRDAVITSYFGITDTELRDRTLAEQATMAGSGTQAAFVVEGTAHVLLADVTQKTSGGVVLLDWITQWANGDPAWANAGP